MLADYLSFRSVRLWDFTVPIARRMKGIIVVRPLSFVRGTHAPRKRWGASRLFALVALGSVICPEFEPDLWVAAYFGDSTVECNIARR